MIVVTAFTPRYKTIADGLIKSCREYDIKCVAYSYPESSWLEATWNKPDAILRAMDDYPSDDVVWIDADARLKRYPELFESIESVGIFSGANDPEANAAIDIWNPNEKRRPIFSKSYRGGTIFFENTDEIENMVIEWLSFRSPCISRKIPDQYCLAYVFFNNNIEVIELPVSYCFVYDTDKLWSSCREPVIEHYQASRKFNSSKIKKHPIFG